MKTLCLCIALLMCAPGVASAAERDTLTVLLIGDSTTKGATPRRVKPDGIHLEEMIEQLAALEPSMPAVKVINSSRGGETALSVVESGRYEEEIAPLKDRKPDYIFVRYGINDWFKCKNLKKEFPENLKSLLRRIEGDFDGSRLVVMTIVPFMPFEECEVVNGLIKEVAEDMGLPLFDIYTPYKEAVMKSGPNTYHVRRIDLEKVDKKYHEWLKPFTYDYTQKGRTRKVVLADDNFATIVKAVKNGRNVYANIKRAIQFLLSGNTAGILTVLYASLMGLPVPFAAVHLLFINLLTDSLPAIALGMEPHTDEVMSEKPRPRNEGILTKHFLYSVGVEGLVIAAATVTAFYLGLNAGGAAAGQTMAFSTLCLSRLFHGFSCKSQHPVLLTRHFWNNRALLGAFTIGALLLGLVLLVPALEPLFAVAPLSIGMVGAIVGLAFGSMVVIQLLKLIRQ